MRVLHISKYDRKGGAALAALSGVRAQRAIGIDARMVVGRARGTEDWLRVPSSARAAATWLGFVAERLPFRLLGYPSMEGHSLGRAGIAPQWLLGGFDPDLIVLHNIDGVVRVADLALLGKPIVWRMHDLWSVRGTAHYPESATGFGVEADGAGLRGLDRLTFRAKRRAYARVPGLTFCPPSHWLAREARASALAAGREVVVVPNGIDTDAFAPQGKAQSRSALGLPQGAPVLLFGAAGGTGDPRKGFDLLAAALTSATPALARTGARLAVFGGAPTPGPDGIPASIPRHDFGRIADRARLAMLYSAADLVVVPSRMENLSLTVLEALACGTPVLAFDIGGMPDMIAPGRTGWLAPPFDTARLGDLIVDGLATAPADPGIGHACRETAVTRFDSGVEARGMRDLFARLIG